MSEYESDVRSVAGELDSPLCEAPESYRRALIGALEPTDGRGFAEHFDLQAAASSPEELVSQWADSHPDRKDHTIRKVFEYAEATQHDGLLQEFHEILRASFIKELSEHIGEDWKALARELGLSRTDIHAIAHDNRSSLSEQIYEFFHKWQQQEGKNASIQKLVSGLVAGNLKEPLRKMSIQKPVGGLVAGILEEPLRKMGVASLLPEVPSGECNKCPLCRPKSSRSLSVPAAVNEQKSKQDPIQRTSLSLTHDVTVHICRQQNPPNQHHENPTFELLATDSSTQPSNSSLTSPATTENSINSGTDLPTMSPPSSPKCDASSQTTSHGACDGTSPRQQQDSAPVLVPDDHPAIESPDTSPRQQQDSAPMLGPDDHPAIVSPESSAEFDPPHHHEVCDDTAPPQLVSHSPQQPPSAPGLDNSPDSHQGNLSVPRHRKVRPGPKPDPPPAPLTNDEYIGAFLQRRFQTKPYTLFNKYYANHRQTIEVVGGIFLVFFVYQVLASFLVTICEDCEFWNALPNGEGVYINILHRGLLFILRISVRIIAPLCSLLQLHWIAMRPQSLLGMNSDGQKPFTKDSLDEFEGSLQRRIESTWITVLHAVLFPLLLLTMDAFAGVKEKSMLKAKVCDYADSSIFAVPLNIFIQLCDCISVFVIFLVMGLAKDCYCYENQIATHLLNFGSAGKKMCKEIRNRWLILDMYCYITSVGFTVFTVLSILAGKAVTPDPSQDLEVGDLVTWYVWISFFSLLLYLGFTSHRYVKGAGLAWYGLAFIFMLAGKLPIRVPPGSSIILIYVTLGMSVFNLLVCLFCSRCRLKKSQVPFSRSLFALCLLCLLLLPISCMAMLVREVVHFAHFVNK